MLAENYFAFSKSLPYPLHLYYNSTWIIMYYVYYFIYYIIKNYKL